ncbi:hypothetical protein TRVA0_001S04016 [Trichomonascus vanleenenianus]|uniref:DUF4210 domain-containing protein n=1 Tax=Trichomonascus vanleenenianus TaxID=2268995 RepID=UPI003EC9CC0A
MPVATLKHLPRRRSSLSQSESLSDDCPRRPILPVCHACRNRSVSGSSEDSRSSRMASSSPRRRSFVGSFEESLISGRMSAPCSAPIRFNSKVVVCRKNRQKWPIQASIPFEAVFYDWGEPGESSPYVGSIDTAHTQDKLPDKGSEAVVDDIDGLSLEEDAGGNGLRIPRQGEIQLFISNANNTPIQWFVVPYNLKEIPDNHKTIIRQKTYDGKSLMRAIHIPIMRPPHSSKIYIDGQIRVVFQNRVSTLSESPRAAPKKVETMLDTFGIAPTRMVRQEHCSNCGKPF